MMNDLIDKLLNDQTTPEEEHLIAQELRQKETDRWLTEDETAEYDRIVSNRHLTLSRSPSQFQQRKIQ